MAKKQEKLTKEASKTEKQEAEIAETPKKERLIGLDILRMLAILFVFITHGLAYKGLLEQNICTKEWTLFVILRFIALSCVPIFILLTGFLNNKKELNWKYYKGIIPLLLSYILISFAELIGTKVVTIGESGLVFAWNALGTIDWKVEIVRILNFTQNSYGWYFEMYIGLFLLIPFLNILWDGLKTKKEKIILVASLCFLTLIPKAIESIRFDWLNSSDLAGWLDVLPDWWKVVHPLAYFFIGKMIKDFKPNLYVYTRVMLVVISVAIPVIACYLTSKAIGAYAWYALNGFGTITNGFVATAIFLMFYDIKKKIPVLSTIVSQIAICSFEMYLFSSIFDKAYYGYFTEKNMFVIVPLVLVSTYICARIWITIRDLIFKKAIKLY